MWERYFLNENATETALQFYKVRQGKQVLKLSGVCVGTPHQPYSQRWDRHTLQGLE